MQLSYTVKTLLTLTTILFLAACSGNRPYGLELSSKEKLYRDLNIKEVRMYQGLSLENPDSIFPTPSRIERYGRDGRRIESVSYYTQGQDSKRTLQSRQRIYQLSDNEGIRFDILVEYSGREFHLTITDILNGKITKKTEYEVLDIDPALLNKLDSINLMGITDSEVYNLGNPSRIIEYKYDDDGLVVKEKVYKAGGDHSKPNLITTIDYIYKNDLLVTKEYNDVNMNEISLTETYTYNDRDSLLSHITRKGNGVITGRVLIKYDTLVFDKIVQRFIDDDIIPANKIFTYRSSENFLVDSTLYYSTGHDHSGIISEGPEFCYVNRSDEYGQTVSIYMVSFADILHPDTTVIESESLKNGLVSQLVGHENNGDEFKVVLEYLYY